MNKDTGFTLVELMVGLAIAAILLFSAPSFVNIVKNNQQATQVNSLLMALTNARDEAITMNSTVSVCQSDDRLECTDSGWADGWIVFSDTGVLGTVDATDRVLSIQTPLDDDTSVTSGTFPDFITYLADGTSSAAGSFAMCDDRGAAHARSLCVAATGRLNTSANNCAGAAISCP
ncbi:MAG: GspH/FimT family pseudopilin [Proteobacteria bacterium]|nr:GspH/FimT family pseudopilin [Pseudomonadota bacterium]